MTAYREDASLKKVHRKTVFKAAILFFAFVSSTAWAGRAPSSFDLRNIGGHSFIGQPRDQGSCGSCYSFGASAASESAYNRYYDRYDADAIDLSESFIMWDLGRLNSVFFYGCGGADYSLNELSAIVEHGLPLEVDVPYVTTDPGLASGNWAAPRVSFGEWYRIPPNDIETMKRVIRDYGALDAGVLVDGDFEMYTDGIFENYDTAVDEVLPYESATNHLISLVGWEDNPADGGMGYWILRNSWGDGWGEEGYMRIRFTSASASLESAYILVEPMGGENILFYNSGHIIAEPWTAGGIISAYGTDIWGGAGSEMGNSGVVTATVMADAELATAKGVYLWGGASAQVINSGTIESMASSDQNQAIAYGVEAQARYLENTGRITATAHADNDQALALGGWLANGGSEVNVLNQGEIAAVAVGEDAWAYGLWTDSRANNDVVNEGEIKAFAQGPVAVSLLVSGGPGTISNSGRIQAIAEGVAIGINVYDDATIVNSGEISATGADHNYAILSDFPADVHLILQTGSNLAGSIQLHGANDLVLLTGSGSEDELFFGVEELFMQGSDWSLSGDSAFDQIHIIQGRLGVDGVLAGETTVMDGGILGGNGTLNGNVTSSGVVSPGHSVGHLTIDGDFSQQADGTLVIETGNATCDLLTVTGTADLAGTLLVLPDGYAGGGSYTFLDAATLSGAFDLIQSVAVLGVDMSSGSPGTLTLDITRNSYTSLATPHNLGLGGNLDRLRPTAQEDFGELLDRLDFAMSRSELNDDLAEMTPRIHGLASAVVLGDSQARLDDLRRHMDRIDPARSSDEEPEGLNSFWIDALGHYTLYDDDGDYFSARENLYGLIVGMERLSRSGLTLGLAAAATKSSYESRDTDDEGEGQSLQGYLYGSWRNRDQPGGLRIAAALGAGETELSADRAIAFAARRTHSKHDGQIYSATLQGRYDWTPAGWLIGPTLGVSYVHLREEGFRESGADSADLKIKLRENNSLQSLLGGRIARPLISGGVSLEPELRVEWRHEFDHDSEDLEAKLAGGGDYFVTPGRDLSSDSLLLGAALKARLSDSIFGALSYDCELRNSGDAIDHALRLQVTMTF